MTTTTLTPEELATRAAQDAAVAVAAAALLDSPNAPALVTVTGAATAVIRSGDQRIDLTGTADAPVRIEIGGGTSVAGATFVRALAEREAAGRAVT